MRFAFKSSENKTKILANCKKFPMSFCWFAMNFEIVTAEESMDWDKIEFLYCHDLPHYFFFAIFSALQSILCKLACITICRTSNFHTNTCFCHSFSFLINFSTAEFIKLFHSPFMTSLTHFLFLSLTNLNHKTRQEVIDILSDRIFVCHH